MGDFSIARSIGLVLRTWPFTVLRLIVYGVIVVAVVVAVSVGAGLGWGLGHIGDAREAAAAWGGVIGFGLVFFSVWSFRAYLLHLLTAGHVAAITLAARGGDLPAGPAQVRVALAEVTARFGEVHLLFVLDQAVKGAVAAVTGLLDGIGRLAGLAGLEGPMRLVGAVLRLSTTFLDELILAREIRLGSRDPWTTAREGVVLYAQNAPLVLRNALWLTALRWLGAGVVFVATAGPAAAAVWILPGPTTGWGLLFALALAIGLQRALIDPFCIACLMQVWERRIEGQTPDPTWDTRLAEASRPFRDLIDRAREG